MPIDPANLAATAVLTFGDEFDTLNLWTGQSGVWATSFPQHASGPGGSIPSNAEKQWYVNSLYPKTAAIRPWSVKNGVLSLTADHAPSKIQPFIQKYRYTSGMVSTWPTFSQTYGYFEMRAELPKGKGFWPAFWLLPQNRTWPPEIDILEVLGKDITTLHTTWHSNAGGKHTGNG